MILDSSFLIDLLAGDDGPVAKFDELADRLLAVPTLAYTEVAIGLERETDASQRLDVVLDRMRLVPYDAEAARRAVDIQRQLLAQGEPMGAIDVMIAGSAVARDEPVVTRKAGEFARTPARISPY